MVLSYGIPFAKGRDPSRGRGAGGRGGANFSLRGGLTFTLQRKEASCRGEVGLFYYVPEKGEFKAKESLFGWL